LQGCPVTTYQEFLLTSTFQIDVRPSRHNGTAGWLGNAELWTKRLAEGDLKQFDQDFAFSSSAPYLTTEDPIEQPIRGQFTVTWTIGKPPATGQRELDSLDARYVTGTSPFVAWVYLKTPVVRTAAPGSVSGDRGVLTGTTNQWRVKTDWDTTGYKFQWYVNGSPSGGDTAATFIKSFNNSGIYSLRVDQILTDSTTLSSYFDVHAYYADIGGPTTVRPTATCSFYGMASGGTEPYSYRWVVNSGEFFTGQFLDYWNSGSGFMVQLIVTDASGAELIISRNISVDSNAPLCSN
jgi:hypothetical protein